MNAAPETSRDPADDPVARRLRARRLERGLTLEALAREASNRAPVSPSYI